MSSFEALFPLSSCPAPPQTRFLLELPSSQSAPAGEVFIGQIFFTLVVFTRLECPFARLMRENPRVFLNKNF